MSKFDRENIELLDRILQNDSLNADEIRAEIAEHFHEPAPKPVLRKSVYDDDTGRCIGYLMLTVRNPMPTATSLARQRYANLMNRGARS